MAILGTLTDLLGNFIDSIELLKKQNKFKKPITKDQLSEVLELQMDMLQSIHTFLATFDNANMYTLTRKYMANIHNLPKDKKYVGDIIPDLKKVLTGRANQLERNATFGAAKDASAKFLSILSEALKNIDQFFNEKAITIDNIKISNMMIFGVFQEIDIFNKYTGYLISQFTDTVSDLRENPKGYRAQYLKTHKEEYVNILNATVNQTGLYSFVQDIKKIKSSKMDIILYADGMSGVPMLNVNTLSGTAQSKIIRGIWGARVIGSIVDTWNEWKHTKYLETKSFKEWMEVHRAKLMQDLQDMDPNSPEAIKLQNIIDSYSEEISEYDSKLAEYEED